VTLDGIEFINAGPEAVISHLKKLDIKRLEVNPSSLHIKMEGKNLILKILSTGKNYPLRKSFLHKLLRWYSFPLSRIERLSGDTVASVCNDFLLNINREYVVVKTEGNEALTITSPDYNEISDLEIIERASLMGKGTISRNDFMMRITTSERYKFQPVKGDDCGMGLCIINSETGFHSLNISYFLLRYICSNGAVIKIDQENNSKIHYGHKKGALNRFLDIKIASAESKSREVIQSIRKLSERKVSVDSEVLRKVRMILSKEELKNIEQMSQYELFNIITDRAKKYDLSRRIFLETTAGEMVL
jgi:hypothetical protein